MKKPLQVQAIIARGKARIRLLAFPKLHSLKVVKPPISDPDLISIIGIGEFYAPISGDEFSCFCVGVPASPSDEASCLRELSEWLARGKFDG
jgi:hypothetical protein